MAQAGGGAVSKTKMLFFYLDDQGLEELSIVECSEKDLQEAIDNKQDTGLHSWIKLSDIIATMRKEGYKVKP